MNDYLKRTWAEINLNHIAGNVKAIQACLRPGCQMMGVVKADAYGHGAVPVAKKLATTEQSSRI